MKNHIISAGVAVVVALLVGLLVGHQSVHFGDGTVSIFPTWYSNGIQIGGTNSKIVKQVNCNTATVTLASIASAGTSSISFVLNGITTSSNQVYLFGNATTSAIDLQYVSTRVSSTANGAEVFVRNISSAAYAPGASSTYSLCYLQF